MEVAKAMSLSSGQSKPQEGKENQRNPIPSNSMRNETNSSSHPSGAVTAGFTTFHNSRDQLPPPPGLDLPASSTIPKPSPTEATSNSEVTEWPDLVSNSRKPPPPAVIPAPPLSTSTRLPPSLPPPGFHIRNQPPRYAAYTASFQHKFNPPPVSQPSTNVIQTAKNLLNNDRDYAEFRRLSGLYAKGAISVKSYYRTCAGLFGDAIWQDIGPRLAQTLPKQDKQHELLALFRGWSLGRPTLNYSQVTSAVGRQEMRRRQKGNWQLGSGVPAGSKSCQLSEEDYPSLSASSKQPDPAIPLPGWNMKVSVK